MWVGDFVVLSAQVAYVGQFRSEVLGAVGGCSAFFGWGCRQMDDVICRSAFQEQACAG
jgi:hypothetical protein